MRKILHLITGLEMGGGAENMILKTIPYLNSEKTENRVCVIKGKGAIGKILEEKGVKVYYLEVKSFFDFGVIKRYKEAIVDFQPDAVINYLIHADIFSRMFSKKFGVKKVISYIRNKHIDFLFVFFDRLTLGKVDYLLTNSESVLDFYRRQYKFPVEKSSCIPNGVRIEENKLEFDKEKFKQDLGIKKEDFIIFNIASLFKQKNHPVLFEAIKILKDKKENNICVLLCGKGKKEKELRELRKELGLEKEIKFLGARSDIYKIFIVSDIFVLFSLHEGMSNALLEAMSLGIPCLVSDIPENKELIEDDVCGLTFISDNPNDFAEKIIYLKNNPQKMIEFGNKAREKIKEKYDIKKIIAKLDNFLENFKYE